MTKTFSIRLPGSSSDIPKSKSGPADKNPKWKGLFTLVIAFTLCGAVAEAQQPKKVLWIGYLSDKIGSRIK